MNVDKDCTSTANEGIDAASVSVVATNGAVIVNKSFLRCFPEEIFLFYNQSETAFIPLTVTSKIGLQMSKLSAEREVKRLQKEV